jgi:hypothetical protein
MQPYFLPYIGYWQLIAAVDKFIILDDVNYINRGWINRNRILCNQVPTWITLPLVGASQNKLICDLEVMPDDGWSLKMEKLVSHSYSKAAYFDATLSLFQQLLAGAHGNLSNFLFKSILSICNHLQIKTEIIPTSRNFPKGELRGQDRIIDICKRVGAVHYFNPIGGKDLYSESKFAEANINLIFKECLALEYPQSGNAFVPWLSIIDVLMWNGKESIRDQIHTGYCSV